MLVRTVDVSTFYIFGMWVFLAPLIAILGTVDFLTDGRSRTWPFGEWRQNRST
jgi:hypothetical protein